jgi:hypothetical protein
LRTLLIPKQIKVLGDHMKKNEGEFLGYAGIEQRVTGQPPSGSSCPRYSHGWL